MNLQHPCPDLPPDPVLSADVWGAVRALREERGETGTEFGAVIGLSKGKVSELESGKYAPSLPVALAIEKLSEKDGVRRIDAAALCEDVALARGVAGVAHVTGVSPADAAPSTGQADEVSGQEAA